MLLIIVIDLLMVGAVWWAMVTASALSEGRTSTVTTNNVEIFDCLKRLAQHLRASAEIVERDGLTDIILRPPSRRKARASFQLIGIAEGARTHLH
jgi:hypothetical protein